MLRLISTHRLSSSRKVVVYACVAMGVLASAMAPAVGAEGYADYPLFPAPHAAPKSNADGAAGESVRQRVRAALHADPYFYDTHVEVSVARGSVVLQGFVFSDWDLRNALRIARAASGDLPVVDNLSIKEAGRH